MELEAIFRELFLRIVVQPKMRSINRLEHQLAAQTQVVSASLDSPVRFEIVDESLKRNDPEMPGFPRVIPNLLSCLGNIESSLASISKNPPDPRTKVDEIFLADFEAQARSLGVDLIGYAEMPAVLVFQEKAAAFSHAIVLAMEMDWENIAKAPHPDTAVMVMQTYDRLGIAANKLAETLRKNGYCAHTAHPLMGAVLYPPLGVLANLGGRGLHGLLVTPEFGSRVRLAAVFTNIENLPVPVHNDHLWVEDFCEICRFCVRKCPPGAIQAKAQQNPNGLFTSVDQERCFPYFLAYHGCSVCISKCPFSRVSYTKIKGVYDKYLRQPNSREKIPAV